MPMYSNEFHANVFNGPNTHPVDTLTVHEHTAEVEDSGVRDPARRGGSTVPTRGASDL